ncbi:MAG: type II secretion system protein N [Pacificimonas sp.]
MARGSVIKGRRFNVRTAYGALELGLLGLLALALARLVWAVVAPIGPVGDWRAAPPLGLSGGGQEFTALAPVFGISATDTPLAISAGDVELFGVRMDQASGRGSAIIDAGEDGQRSYRVGEEVASGLTLFEVRADHVILDRGGAREALFLDQSAPAERVNARAAPVSEPRATATSSAPTPALAFSREFAVSPRLDGGTAGMMIRGAGTGRLFRQAGFRPGDVLTAIDGAKVATADDVRGRLTSVVPGQSVVMEIERGGETVQLNIKVPE